MAMVWDTGDTQAGDSSASTTPGLRRPRPALLPVIPEINLTTHTKMAINFRDYVSLLFFGEVCGWI